MVCSRALSQRPKSTAAPMQENDGEQHQAEHHADVAGAVRGHFGHDPADALTLGGGV